MVIRFYCYCMIVLVQLSCMHVDNTLEIQSGKYIGKVLIAYYLRENREMTEITIIPFSSSVEITQDNLLEKLNAIKVKPGVSTYWNFKSNHPLNRLLGSAHQYNLQNRGNITELLQRVYILPAFVEINGFVDLTKPITKSENKLEDCMTFETGETLCIKYSIVRDLKINSVTSDLTPK